MDRKGQFQLLPGTKKRLGIKAKGENKFLYIGSAILGAALVTSFAMSRYETSLLDQISTIDDQIKAIDQKRNIKAEENLKIVKHQVDTTLALMQDHVYWTKGLYKISSLIQNEVELNSLSYTGNDKISMSLMAANYTVLARQVASFLYDDSVKDLSLGKISSAENGKIESDITLIFDASKLIKDTSLDKE